MSRLKSIAFAIKERIEEIDELAGAVVVYNPSSIESEFERRMGKLKGKLAIVRLTTAKNTSRNKTSARFSGTYTVSLFTTPILNQKDAKDSDDLMDEIVDKLHGWWPESIPSNGIVWADADTLTYQDDPQFDVTVLKLECPRQTP